MTKSTVRPYLPSLEGGRKLGLVGVEEPAEVHQLCALVVNARVIKRKQWREQRVAGREAVRRMRTTLPALPKEAKSARYVTLEKEVGVEPCLGCAARRARGETNQQCRKCMIRIWAMHTNDTLAQMHETYVPSHVGAAPGMLSFESALEQLTGSQRHEPPAVLRCHDLRPRRGGGAYRAAAGKTRPPDFHGFGFGDTIEQASGALERFFLGGEVSAYDIRAWAWPFSWLRYRSGDGPREVVLLVDHRVQLDAFVGLPADAQ